MNEYIVRIASLCIMLACVETLHGIIRAAILVPRTGKKKALIISIFTGSILAFCVCYLLIPPIGITDTLHLFSLGALLAIFMASFDIILGRFVLKLAWSKIATDFNPKTGNYLLYGLLLLAVYPYLVMNLP